MREGLWWQFSLRKWVCGRSCGHLEENSLEETVGPQRWGDLSRAARAANVGEEAFLGELLKVLTRKTIPENVAVCKPTSLSAFPRRASVSIQLWLLNREAFWVGLLSCPSLSLRLEVGLSYPLPSVGGSVGLAKKSSIHPLPNSILALLYFLYGQDGGFKKILA